MKLENIKSEDILNVIDDYKGIGYGINTDQELQLLKKIINQSAIVLDPVYSLKAANGLIHHPAFHSRKVLFIHTGGIFGLYPTTHQMEQAGVFSSSIQKLL